MKKVIAIPPYQRKEGLGLNFKFRVFEAWKESGGKIGKSHYPIRSLHKLAYDYDLPRLTQKKDVALLRFAEANSIRFDTFPEYSCYEIIPLIWDLWPKYFDKTCSWLEKYKVKTVIVTSCITAERLKKRFPVMNVLTITEGINTDLYKEGKPLAQRDYNLMEIGRKCRNYFSRLAPEEYTKLCNKPYSGQLLSNDDFFETLGNSKVTVLLPKCVTEPQIAGDVETLTQRYWECMLSRIVMVGVAPKELTDLIGYNPLIDIDFEHATEQVWDIVNHISEYQDLVDKNRDTALQLAPWSIRILEIKKFLKKTGYLV